MLATLFYRLPRKIYSISFVIVAILLITAFSILGYILRSMFGLIWQLCLVFADKFYNYSNKA